ncbi:lysophospholipase L1-like esterase [Arthrobacter sp. UYP6]|uniref:SGNH/GDSL hydrolase family protein n=1 Tax=Arthrobacter sp. UYP6 TaxID=1756378 RepID=UPI0033978464
MKRLAAGALSLAVMVLAGCAPDPAQSSGLPTAGSTVSDSAAARTSAPSAPSAPADPTTEAGSPGLPAAGPRLAALLGNSGGPADVVLLGDSFAAGEGAGSYQPVGGVAESLCHRSAAALFADAAGSTVVHNFACSRARVSSLGAAQPMPGHGPAGIPAQLEQLGGLRPDLVVLYIGGNDVGFAGLLQACIAETEPCGGDPTLLQSTERTLRELRAPLARLYTAVGTAVQAPVLVLPYPQLFDTAQGACGRLSPNEQSLGLEVTDALNSTIEQSVEAAGQPNVRYVDALEDSFALRGACGDDPLVVTARLGPLLNAAASESAAQEVLHPTQEGYRVLTGDLLRWMEEHPG